MEPIVSIVAPCYNGEMYVSRMLESVLGQTYRTIEMVCVNDGSVDSTEKILRAYGERFQEAGMVLRILSQTNQGQAAALDAGLKVISGTYLSWIDCDDFLFPQAVEKKVRYLEQNAEVAIVTADLYETDERYLSGKQGNTLLEAATACGRTKGQGFGDLNSQSHQFFLTLIGKSVMECHAHMLRVDAMRRINPEMSISHCRAGQNYQMLLPMYYYFKRGYIDEPLSCYVIRRYSHYHRPRSYEEEKERLEGLLEMLCETFSAMGLPQWEIERYQRMSIFASERKRLIEHGRDETMVGKCDQ